MTHFMTGTAIDATTAELKAEFAVAAAARDEPHMNILRVRIERLAELRQEIAAGYFLERAPR